VPFFHKPWAMEIETPDALMPLARVLAPAIVLQTPYAVGEESQLAQSLKRNENGVVLIAWEHHHVPDLASAFPGRDT
jgi:hypothetical protein